MFVMFLNAKVISQILQYEILKKLVTFIIDVTHLGGRPFYDVTLNTNFFSGDMWHPDDSSSQHERRDHGFAS